MPDQAELAHYFFKALDRTYELLQETGKKLVIGNFANLLLGLVAPGARRLMCDISPCGGGRCFFAVAPRAKWPRAANFWASRSSMAATSGRCRCGALKDQALQGRHHPGGGGLCAVQPLCGASLLRRALPAEVYAINGKLEAPAPLCDFYTAQARYAFRVIAQDRLTTTSGTAGGTAWKRLW